MNLYRVSLLFLVAVMLLTLPGCTSEEHYRTDSVSEYMQLSGHITNEGLDIRSGLFIFPESPVGMENVQYTYACKYGALDNSYLLFLKGTYPDQAAYDAELQRLQGISCSVSLPEETANNTVQYSETLFAYPAYITVYNTNLSFEYALTDAKTRSIVYVYIKLYEGADFLPSEYLPLEFAGSSMMDYDSTWTNQNIYYAPCGNGDHAYYKD